MSRLAIAAALAALLAGLSGSVHARADHARLTRAERQALIRRAQIWTRTDVASMNIVAGPREGAFAPDATVTCDFVERDFDGDDPKFACAIGRNDVVKVRYGRDNGEVYAGVAASRLLWALGFGVDALYPVRVVCRGCPEKMQASGMAREKSVTFDVAAIERRHAGREMETEGIGDAWAWPELDLVDEQSGGATRAQRDALKLLAAMLQHVDSKPIQQRLLCLDEEPVRGNAAACARPYMMIHDVGHTFGHSRVLEANDPRGSLRVWSAAAVWKDPASCIANITPARAGTLRDPAISEPGRAFLAGLLARLTDAQLRDLFRVARFDTGAHAGDSIDGWVHTFAQKRREIASAHCPQEG